MSKNIPEKTPNSGKKKRARAFTAISRWAFCNNFVVLIRVPSFSLPNNSNPFTRTLYFKCGTASVATALDCCCCCCSCCSCSWWWWWCDDPLLAFFVWRGETFLVDEWWCKWVDARSKPGRWWTAVSMERSPRTISKCSSEFMLAGIFKLGADTESLTRSTARVRALKKIELNSKKIGNTKSVGIPKKSETRKIEYPNV